MIGRGLYGMLDTGVLVDDAAVVDGARVLARKGVRTIQLRAKQLGTIERTSLGEKVLAQLAPGTWLFVNDDVAAARAIAAKAPSNLTIGVHLGQDDGPAPLDLPVGRSTHTLEHVHAATGVVYIGFGPVFGTQSKVTTWTNRGVDALREAVRHARVPVVAIGGISAANVHEVRAAGAHAWAVIGGVWRADDPAAAIDALHR